MRLPIILRVIVLGMLVSSTGLSAPMLDGRSSGFWNIHSVLYVQVLKAENGVDGGVVQMKILSTITGSIDAIETPQIEASAVFGDFRATIVRPPSPESYAIALVARRGRLYAIPNENIKFFPDSSGKAIVPVTGFDDPKVAEIRRLLIDVRRHEQP